MPESLPNRMTSESVPSTESAWPIINSPRPSTTPPGPTRLLLACHAENVQSRSSRLTPEETGLSALGWEQTMALAQWLHTHEEIETLLTDSPLRVRLTAQRIGQELGLPLRTLAYLPRGAEPEWALTPPNATPDNATPDNATPDNTTPDSPDPAAIARYAAYCAELTDALAQLLADRWGKTTVLVADAVAIASLVRAFAGNPGMGIRIGLASLSELRYHEGVWSLAYVNRAEHLPQSARRPQPQPPGSSEPEQIPDLEMTAQIEKSAHFYNQVAQRLGEEQRQAQEGARTRIQDLNGELIRQFGELDDANHLLLAGAGSGQLALDLAQIGISEVVGVDISPGMLERAEVLRLATHVTHLQVVNFRLAPAHSLPFSDGRFDVALCVHLLHHLAKPLSTLRELRRILPAHGKLIVIDIDGSSDAVKRATQNAIESKRNPTHATIRTHDQWVSLLEQSGFQVEKEQRWTVERNATAWLDSIAVGESTRVAVVEMLEASIETDAAGLHVRRQGDELRFDAHVIALLARKTTE